MLKNKNRKTIYDFVSSSFSKYISSVLVCLITLIIVLFSTFWQGQYDYDPHHWGLMFSNAKDLANGNLPYKDIFIQYGFLTTFIHFLFYKIHGNILTLILGTGLFYAIGLIGLYFLSLQITKNYKISTYIVILSLLIHPTVIYPWSNYIAFPFLVFAFIFYLKSKKNILIYFLSGVFFGLSILAREGLLIPVSLSVCLLILNSIFTSDKMNDSIKSSLLMGSGFLLSGFVFLFYLFQTDLLQYWYKLSWTLPKLYLPLYPDASLKGIFIFFYDLLKKAGTGDFRWLMFLLIYIFSFILIIESVIKKKIRLPFYVVIAIASIFFIQSSLHIREIFRLSTASIIGIIPLFVFLERYNQATTFFWILFFALSTSAFKNNSGNYFIPTKNIIKSSVHIHSPQYFSGQKWNEDVKDYYLSIDADLQRINAANCQIKYHYNFTRDSFLKVLSPFKQYQVATSSMMDGLEVEGLRPEFDIKEKERKSPEDIMIFFTEIGPNKSKNTFPENFYIYRYYKIPQTYFIEPNQVLQLLLPKSCSIK